MIGSSENRISYNGNGIATEFAYTFKILEKSDIKVLHVAIDGTEELLTTDYYVDMEKSVVLYPGYAPGAEIPEQNRPPILPVGERLVLYREVPITQESALDKHWPFNVIEAGLDKLTIICQQLFDRLQRSFYVSESTSTNFDTKVPVEAGKTFRVKDDGTGFEVTEDPAKVQEQAASALKTVLDAKDHIDQTDYKIYVGETEPTEDITNAMVWINPAEDDNGSDELAEAVTAAQNAANEVKKIYNDGNFTPLSDLSGSLGTKEKRWAEINVEKINGSELPYVTPEMFGAVGDGVADDTEAIKQAFLTNCNIVLFSKDKTYLVNDWLIVKNTKCIIGNNATIKLKDNSDLLLTIATMSKGITPAIINLLAKSCVIDNLNIDVNLYNNGIVYNGEIYHAYYNDLGNFHSFGVNAYNIGADNCVIKNCIIVNASWCGIETSPFTEQFLARDGYIQGGKILNNSISYCGRDGISLSRNKNAIIADNHLTNNYWHDIHVYTNNENITVERNVIKLLDYGVDLYPNYNVLKEWCLQVEHKNYPNSHTRNVYILNNSIDVSVNAVYGINVEYGAENVSIIGNDLKGIRPNIINRGANCSLIIKDNTFYANNVCVVMHIDTTEIPKSYMTNGINCVVFVDNNIFNNAIRPFKLEFENRNGIINDLIEKMYINISSNIFNGDSSNTECIMNDPLIPNGLRLNVYGNINNGYVAIISSSLRQYTIADDTIYVRNQSNPYYAMCGNIVNIKFNSYSGSASIGTVPLGYIPKIETQLPCTLISDNTLYHGLVRIQTNGQLDVVTLNADGTNTKREIQKLSMSGCYIV